MAIKGFIPQVWQQALVNKTERSIVGKNFVTEVSGQDIAFGNAIHINTFGDIKLQDYVNGKDLENTELDLTDNLLNIDKQKAFNIGVYDSDMAAVRDSVELMTKVIEGSTMSTSEQIDIDIFTSIIENSTVLDEMSLSNSDSVKELFRTAKVKMDGLYVPKVGRKAAVSSAITSFLLTDDAFAAAYYTLQNSENPLLADGYIGKYLGFEIFETELVPMKDDKMQALFTHPVFNYFAHQISSLEDIRMSKGFGDYIRGLNVYGNKTVIENSIVIPVSFQ